MSFDDETTDDLAMEVAEILGDLGASREVVRRAMELQYPVKGDQAAEYAAADAAVESVIRENYGDEEQPDKNVSDLLQELLDIRGVDSEDILALLNAVYRAGKEA